MDWTFLRGRWDGIILLCSFRFVPKIVLGHRLRCLTIYRAWGTFVELAVRRSGIVRQLMHRRWGGRRLKRSSVCLRCGWGFHLIVCGEFWAGFAFAAAFSNWAPRSFSSLYMWRWKLLTLSGHPPPLGEHRPCPGFLLDGQSSCLKKLKKCIMIGVFDKDLNNREVQI